MTTITEAAPEAKVVAGSDGLLLEIDGQIVPNYDATFTLFEEGEVVTGIVVRIDNDEVLVDIGYKSEGVIPSNELSIRKAVDPHDEVEMGEEVDALVLTKEDQDGRLIMSKKRARFEKAWRRIEAAAESGEPVEGTVIEVVKGGLIIDLGVRGFLPASLVDIRRVPNLDEYLHTKIECKVIELNRSRNNVVLSRRAVLEEERKEQRQEILDRLQPGLIVEGQISNIVDFGAFVDLNGIDGLIHISELSWSHVNHPSEILSIGDTVAVKVLDIDRERQRISLGLKQTQEDPWQRVVDTYNVGDELEGTVTKVVTFGAFVEILDGVEGLVHISELAPHHVENPREIVAPGDEVKVKILEIDSERRRLSLSVKRVEGQVLEPKVLPPEELAAVTDDGSIEDAEALAGLAPDAAVEPDVVAEPEASPPRTRTRPSRRRPSSRTSPSSPPRKRSPSPRSPSPRLPSPRSPSPRSRPLKPPRLGPRPRPTHRRPKLPRTSPKRLPLRQTSQPRTDAPPLARVPFIGLTGGLGAGKSTALEALERLGAATLSTDAVVHELYATAELRDAVVARWGADVAPDGIVDRAAIAARAFSVPEERAWLEGEIWPRVAAQIAAWREQVLARDPAPPAAVVETPLLFESGMDANYDATVAVIADESVRVERAAARGHVGIDERAARQLSQEEKARRATYTVVNSGTVAQLERELSDMLARVRAR